MFGSEYLNLPYPLPQTATLHLLVLSSAFASELANLPIAPLIPQLLNTLETHATVLLQAPAGAGKSTTVPLCLLNAPFLAEHPRIWMLEPRRLAAKAVSARMAQHLGERVGQTVGYQVRFERQISSQTQIEVITEGILLRRLQQDPSLDGVGCIIFDEFHERSLQADTTLALCREIQSALRPDLKLLIMSATLIAADLQAVLTDAPILQSEGRTFPVDIHYLPQDPDPKTPVAHTVTASIGKALQDVPRGDLLVFLAGSREITQTQQALSQLLSPAQLAGLSVLRLHGDLPPDQQQAALQPDPQGRRKIVLSSAIAETSLTIAGVTVVIDSGWSRVPQFDPNSGLSRLTTVRVSADSATQRAGRAGRVQAGVCYRLWSEARQARLSPQRLPEILQADLAPLLLELGAWGNSDIHSLDWISPPPKAALQSAQHLLQDLGAWHNGRLTDHGKALLALPTHPRLGHLLLSAQAAGVGVYAADIAALLEERDPLPRAESADIWLRLQALHAWRKGLATAAQRDVLARIDKLSQHWQTLLKLTPPKQVASPELIGRLLALAYPERIAQRRPQDASRYRLAAGKGARLHSADPLSGSAWLVAAQVDAGQEEGWIQLAAAVDPQDLQDQLEHKQVIRWDEQSQSLQAEDQQCFGSLVWQRKALNPIPSQQRREVLCAMLRKNGLDGLAWSDTLRQWQARAQSLHLWRGEAWPAYQDSDLQANLEHWLAPFLDQVRKYSDLKNIPLADALQQRLDWSLLRPLEQLAPSHLAVPSGSMIRLQYSLDGAAPILAVKLQELFGLADTPSVNEGRNPVVLHLLSPAQRPVQITQDLRSFWNSTYQEVRKELKIRYPKHPWPEDPWNAPATRGTIRRPR